MQSAPEPVEVVDDFAHRFAAAEEELKRPAKVLIVVLIRFVVEGQHLVGGCRYEQDPGLRLPEQCFCELGRFILAIQEFLKSLEFIENHQVWLKGANADAGEATPQRRYQGVSPIRFIGCEIAKPVKNFSSFP